MRIFTGSIIIGSFLLIGALPAAADQSTLVLGSSSPIRLAASGDPTGDRDTYTQKARDEMQEWRRKLDNFSKKAEAKGREASNAADNDLNKAWAKTKAASRKLQTTGTQGWESAKTSFEKASGELAAAWDKIQPNDK
jgi:hypothetical protein